MVTNDQFQNWKRDKVTQALIASIKGNIEEFKESWSDSAFGLDNPTNNAYNLGSVRALKDILLTLETGNGVVEVESSHD